MIQQQPQQTGDSTQAEARSEWIAPEFSRLDAGAAEAADINNTDGAQTS